MKLVIDIPEEDYNEIEPFLNGEKIKGGFNLYGVLVTILNGTQLPKGHGRLIDADAFIAMMEDASKNQKYKELLIDNILTVDDVLKAVIESLQNKGLANGDTPTIIDADKEESEDKA